jgi:hypothetical protein
MPAHGGRSLRLLPAVEFDGRFEPPNPCGARPESVALPWAFQVRAELPLREPLPDCTFPLGRFVFVGVPRSELLPENPPLRLPPACAEGGRFAESSDARLLLRLLCSAFPPFGVERAFSVPELCPNELEFTVRTFSCAAAADGVVRAITLRFCTLAEGRATLLWALAAPNALEREGVALILLVTCAPFNEACVRC